MKLLPLTLLLVTVLALSMLGSYLQHRYYMRVVNRLAADYKSADYVLASGIRKGKLRGALAVLVLRRDDPQFVERAVIMNGSTMMARFREREDLHGRIDPTALTEYPRAVRGAVQDALTRGHKIARPTDSDEPTVPAPQPREAKTHA